MDFAMRKTFSMETSSIFNDSELFDSSLFNTVNCKSEASYLPTYLSLTNMFDIVTMWINLVISWNYWSIKFCTYLSLFLRAKCTFNILQECPFFSVWLRDGFPSLVLWCHCREIIQLVLLERICVMCVHSWFTFLCKISSYNTLFFSGYPLYY